MKYNYLAVLCSTFLCTMLVTPIWTSPCFIQGTFRGDAMLDGLRKYEQYPIFFEGKKVINTKEGLFKIPVEKRPEQLSILICKKTEMKMLAGTATPDYFYLDKNEPYKYYIMSDKNNQEWECATLPESLIIPKNTVVIYMNPAHIEGVEVWNITLAEHFIKLPQIKIGNAVSAHDLALDALECTAFACDIARYHEKVLTA